MGNYFTTGKAADCYGCQACAQKCPAHAISMEPDREGFLYPAIDGEKCSGCKLCHAVCPGTSKAGNNKGTGIEVYGAINNDREILESSSSGGVFQALAAAAIARGGVVFGARYTDSFSVAHDLAEDLPGCAAFSGSKYVQGSIGNTYKRAEEILRQGRPVLFTGTPCQIGGLYAYLDDDPENLLTTDIICHGVPSPTLFRQYLDLLEQRYGARVKNVNFKDKRRGWRLPSLSIEFINGESYTALLGEDPFIQIWSSYGLISRPSCHQCEYATTPRSSDITIGDFWGGEKCHSEFMDEKGTSLILVNSPKGKEFFQGASASLRLQPTSLQYAMQMNLYKPTPAGEKRKIFFRDLEKYGFEKALNLHTKGKITLKKILSRILQVLQKAFQTVCNRTHREV